MSGPDPAGPLRSTAVEVDLDRSRHIHVIGAGGAGMSAIAVVLDAMGHTVSGSDARSSVAVSRLTAAGLQVQVAPSGGLPPGVELVIRSTAVPDSDPEVRAAREVGIPVLARADVLAAICARRRTLAVAGTHGKTTTSAMLAVILLGTGGDPSFIVGGDINGVGPGARWSGGDLLVVEADESDGTFLMLPAAGSVVTNVEPDHLDFYGDAATMRRAYELFVLGTAGPVVVCADDPGALALADAASAAGHPVISYGTRPGSRWWMRRMDAGRGGSDVELELDGAAVGTLRVPLPGVHNARNAVAALALATAMGVDPAAAMRALAGFAGVGRRWERRGERDGVTYIDDYGHLPAEVAAVVTTAAAAGYGRVIAVFQPHRYSRTEALWPEFGRSFAGADVVVVSDVYPAGEAPRPGVSGRLVADAVLAAGPGPEVHYAPDRPGLVALLSDLLRPGDLCLTLGAGDLTTLPDDMLGRP